MNGNTSLLLVVLGAVVLALFAWPRIARAQQDPDAQVLAQLRKAGSDLSKPHTIQFHLRVPSQKEANAAATELQAGEYDTAVRQGRDGHNWLCVAQKSMTPTIENLSGARRMFMDLAARYHGEYDGWDAAVEP